MIQIDMMEPLHKNSTHVADQTLQKISPGDMAVRSSSAASSRSSSPHPPSTSSSSSPTKGSPRINDVICARGKEAKLHPGNKRYREILSEMLPRYASLTTKLEKSLLVSEIVDAIHSNDGHFIKKQGDDKWVTVEEAVYREKIGQNLRDQLSTKYKSSAKSKRRRRAVQGCAMNTTIQVLIESNAIVKMTLQELQEAVEQTNAAASSRRNNREDDDELIMELFNDANIKILEALKKDTLLVERFNQIVQQ